jgi:glycosyltransferase involved in cell wall biosynthesis
MRVLHVLGSGDIGGIQRVVHDLCVAQLDGTEVVPSVLVDNSGPFSEAFRSLPMETIPMHTGSCLLARARDIPAIRRAATRNDLVHLHGFAPTVALALVLSRRPIVFHEHGVFGQGRHATLRDLIRRRLKGFFLRHRTAGVVANSRFTAQWAAELYGLHEQQVKVVYNGVSPSMLTGNAKAAAGESTSASTPLVVGGVGRLAGFKRFDRLVRAIAFARAQAVRLLLVGDGPEHDALSRLAAELGIAEATRFTGAVTDVSRLLAEMDLFVLPSSEEPFGLVVLEALAAGLPVVVFSDAGGPIEILDRLGCGQVVTDETELAALIRDAAQTGILPSVCGLDRVEEMFGIHVMVERLMPIYRCALA